MKFYGFADPSSLSCRGGGGGRCHIVLFLVSTMRIFSKLCTRMLTTTVLLFRSGWMKMSKNTNLCDHFANDVAGTRNFG